MLAILVAGDCGAQHARHAIFLLRRAEYRGARYRSTTGAQRGEAAKFVGGSGHQAHSRSRIASAASFARGAKSPAGPTQEGQPASQGHARINSRVFSVSNSCTRNSGSENPMPPG